MTQKKTFGSIGAEPLAPRGILKAHNEANEVKPITKKKAKKKPKQEKEALVQFSAYFTEGQIEIIEEKAGLAPSSTYLRHALKQMGFFDKK